MKNKNLVACCVRWSLGLLWPLIQGCWSLTIVSVVEQDHREASSVGGKKSKLSNNSVELGHVLGCTEGT